MTQTMHLSTRLLAAAAALQHEAEPAMEAGRAGAEHGADVGSAIIHHVSDGRTLELPFVGEIDLPHLEIGGLDLSITRHVVMMWAAAVLLILLFSIAFRRRERVPRGMANLLEMLVVFVRDELALKNIGEQGRRFTPYLLTTFFFILTCNLLGLVPYMATPTSNLMVTAGLALLAFAAIQWGGIREHGLVRYLKNIVPHGVPLWLYPVMVPVEIVGMLAKPFALCVRLFANMTAGHIVILSLLGLIFSLKTALVAPVSVGFALFINLLELLVAFIQAYIFTMLTSVFIGMTVHAH
jgi:F-type H+-transporting ATPase subunit a